MAWIWRCNWNNNASDWRDSEVCRAGSRKPVKNKVSAEKSAKAHERKSGHISRTSLRKVHGNIKLR